MKAPISGKSAAKLMNKHVNGDKLSNAELLTLMWICEFHKEYHAEFHWAESGYYAQQLEALTGYAENRGIL